MRPGAYLFTGGICAAVVLISLVGGNTGAALLFGLGVAINGMLYRRAVDREELDMLRWQRDHPDD